MMKLIYLMPNDAWVFIFGDAILCLEHCGRFFRTRGEAIAAAAKCGLSVDQRGNVGILPDAERAA